MSSDEWKMVIVVRRDLKLSKGKMAAQVAHAAVTLALQKRTREDGKRFRDWYDDGQRKVVLYVPTEPDLVPLLAHARSIGLMTALIRDAGHTEIPAGTVTCLGIGPGKDAEIEPITGHLRLA